MKKSIENYIAILVALFGLFGFVIELAANTPSSQNNAHTNTNFYHVNELRKSLGTQPLNRNASLDRAAQIRAVELAELFSHTRPDGRDPYTSMTENGYNHTYAAENIAHIPTSSGDGIGESFFQNWKESPGHYRNMTNPNYKDIGIGIYNVGNDWYAVQLFGASSDKQQSYTPENETKQEPEIETNIETVVDYSYDSSTGQNEIANQTLSLFNKMRRSAGVTALNYNPLLERAALTRARELAGYASEFRPDGRETVTAIEDIGYNYERFIYMFMHTTEDARSLAETVYQQIATQESDAQIMVDSKLKDIGISYYQQDDVWHVVIFIATRAQ